MQKILPNPARKIQIRRVPQISDDHCGPAVLQMLLDNLGIEISQEKIAEAAGVLETIKIYGTRIDQLGSALKKLAPQVRLWYKKDSTLDNIRILLREHAYPVGVEWQGIFEREEEEDDETDYGHYSMITHIDDERKALIIVDPYRDFVSQDRIISISQFLKRWWDTNEITDRITGKKHYQEDNKLLFIVTPRDVSFPRELQMQCEFP
ncbi:hypothetical protein COT62_00010 [Candidatus Roizmanbacteria bacterium CG09_land_8_20_14_0_10_41_9]|uniref:Peptidase C39 domain-containing protein n=1 Tax=Candidatus Roizmanbacteria bacterium CG09_land_8_20_14_0_10_41_9 TaxID=1974850 RepID=A0A2H0WTY4_9BACT|nr:MAG: hypothetical protein COT62_00010 [Candidatus Roizmanbacteria bacterium CG09_land_8_20_14_0_10_41_9]